MELDGSLSWLALALTPGLASRLSARVLRKVGSPDGVFRASRAELESCNLPAQVAQAIVKKESFRRKTRSFMKKSWSAGPSSASFRCERIPRRRIFR
jgi:hypothetical protein